MAPTVACENTVAKIDRVEHVVLTVSFVHRRRGDVSIDLISPSNTRSEMLSTRKYDDSDEGLDEWHFMTVYCWGKFFYTIDSQLFEHPLYHVPNLS